MLPDLSGFELCSQIRQFSFAPIIFLTACAGDLDKVTGLALGGDDYITKPFNPLEVTARIKAILRRQTQYAESAAKINHFDYGAFRLQILQAPLSYNTKLDFLRRKVAYVNYFLFRFPDF